MHCSIVELTKSVVEIQETDLLVVRLVHDPQMSCLHALETEHNELIDLLTEIHPPEPNTGHHPGASRHHFPPSKHPGLLTTAQPI